MAKRITRQQRQRAAEMPTTGDGYRSGQKPQHSQTNGVPKFGGWVAKLIRRSTDGGRHS